MLKGYFKKILKYPFLKLEKHRTSTDNFHNLFFMISGKFT